MICNKIINFQHGGLGRQIPSRLLSQQHQGCCREAAHWQQPRIPPRQHSPRGCPGARWRGERLAVKPFVGLPCAVASNRVFWASPAQSSSARGGGSGREGGKGIPPGYLRSWDRRELEEPPKCCCPPSRRAPRSALGPGLLSPGDRDSPSPRAAPARRAPPGRAPHAAPHGEARLSECKFHF